MKTILGLLLVSALAMPLHATPQEGDPLLLKDGTTRFVHNFRISRSAAKKLNAWKAKSGNSGNTSTANFDGFYAKLEIKDDKLFLTKVEVDAPPGPRGLIKPKRHCPSFLTRRDRWPPTGSQATFGSSSARSKATGISDPI